MKRKKMFSGRTVLIIGGATPLIMGLVHSFLNQDATVIVPVRELDEIDNLKRYVRKLSTGILIPQLASDRDYNNPVSLSEELVQKFGKIDLTIRLLSESEYRTLLSDTYITEWLEMTEDDITPFFVSARIVLHLLKDKRSRLFINLDESAFAKLEDSSPLARASFTVKLELAGFFEKQPNKENTRYYHVSIENTFNNNVSGDITPERLPAELIGEHIMKLYHKEKLQADGAFQSNFREMVNN